MKKRLFALLALFLLTLLGFHLDFQRFSNESGCPFCRKEVLDAQTFYEGEGVLGILTYKPAVPGHVLIIPKRHVDRFEELTAEEIAALGVAIQKVDRAVRNAFGHEDYLLLQKNGRGAGQSVPHLHFHYVPAARFLALRFFASPWLKPLKQEEIKLLKETLAGAF